MLKRDLLLLCIEKMMVSFQQYTLLYPNKSVTLNERRKLNVHKIQFTPCVQRRKGDGILTFFTVFMFNNNFENIVNTNMYFNYS